MWQFAHESTKQQVDVTQYCRYDFLLTLKTDQVAKKNAKLSPNVDNDGGGSQTQMCLGSSDFLT